MKERTMTPEERKLVTDLFDRLATLEDAQRDPEAERLVKDGLRQAPNAPYALVQTVLVQDEALRRANAHIRELEGAAEEPARDTSFLGTMRDALLGPRESRGSVPSVRSGSVSPGPTPAMSPAWRTGTPSMPAGPQPMQAVPQPMQMQAGPMAGYGSPMGMGGSFLGTAASTAAGVIGGALLLDGIRSMMGHSGAAHAAVDPGAHAAFDPAASSPWSGDTAGGQLSHDAGLDDIGGGTARASDPQASRFFDNTGGDDQDVPDFDDSDDGAFDPDDGGTEDV
jgi:uncharacterized protein